LGVELEGLPTITTHRSRPKAELISEETILIKTEKILGVLMLYKTHSFKTSACTLISSLLSKLVFSAMAVLTVTTLPVSAQLVGASTSALTNSASVSPLRVASITPFKRLSIGGGLYDYSYQVALGHTSNTTSGVYAVKAELSSLSANFAVQMGQVVLDLLLPNTVKTSDNQITVRAPLNFDARFDAQGNPSLIPTGSLTKPTIETSVFIWKFDAENDTVAPEIKDLRAEVAGDGAARKILIQASYSDTGSGIDTTGLKLRLNGLDVTSAARITLYGLEYTANLSNVVSQNIELEATDRLGNKATKTTTLKPEEFYAKAGAATETLSATSSAPGGATGTSSRDVAFTSNTAVTAVVTPTPAAVLTGVQQVIPQAANPTNTGNPASPVATNTTVGVQVAQPRVSVAITSPQPNAVLAADALPVINAEVSGGNTESGSLLVELDGQNITSQVLVNANSLIYTPSQILFEGVHILRISIKDKTGNTVAQTASFKTATPPVIAAQTPKDTFLPGGTAPTIAASFSDVGSGIDTSKIKLLLNGTDVSAQSQISAAGISFTAPQALPDATHQVKLMVTDKAGNSTASEWQFGTASPPVVTANTPKDVLLPAGSRPTISASFSDARSGINASSVRLIVNSDDVTAQSQVSASGISYTPAQPLAAGPYTVYVEVANTTNAAANAVWGFEVEEVKTYSLAITSPAGAQSVIASKVTVTVSVSANKTYATRVSLGGIDMQLTGNAADGASIYSGSADLIDGVNSLSVVATYADGQSRYATTEVSYDAPPKLTILSPADKAVLGPVSSGANTLGGATNLTGNVERPVTVTGRLSKSVTSVTINQQQATLEQGGLAFSFPNYFLREGANLLTVVATDAKGRVVSSAINVSVDQTAPILSIEFPKKGHVTRANSIDIRGMVNDAVEAAFGAPEPTVTVNGIGFSAAAAQVADRYFQVNEIPLRMGLNTLTIAATDNLGNARVQTLEVQRADTGIAGVLMESGNNQTARAKTELAQPLRVLVLNAAGEPAINQTVVFNVLRGTGSISPTQGQSASGSPNYTARSLVLKTDTDGKSQVWFTSGKQSGPGANAIEVSAPDLGGEAVLFTANTQRGDVGRITADFGQNQISETNAQTMEILSAVVRDGNNNPLPNVQVRFKLEEGDALFADTPAAIPSADRKSITLFTDKNGVVGIRPTIGNTAGTVRISAQALRTATGSFDNSADMVSGAQYIIRAKQAQNGPATFIGVVYDDKGGALQGVRVSIGRTALSSTTDDQGKFELANIPPGRIDLFVDGRTTNPQNDLARAQYPSLHFEAYAVKGQVNQLAHAIYLPALAAAQGKVVGGNEDVILTIEGLEGFQMKVKANSVTFPDGSRVGTLVVSPVTADKLPMAPPAGGAQFGVPAWTIQPAGTRFDPPIELQLPNATGEIPGDNLPVVQWDHDLNQYVPMGRATVSGDGAFLVTDVGSGLTKAGWGGLCRYDECKTAVTTCPDCKKIEFQGDPPCPTCVVDTALEGKGCGGNKCKVCKGGSCEKDKTADGNKIGSLGGQIALAGEIGTKAKVITRALGVVFDLGGNINLQYSGEESCCYSEASGSAVKIEISGGGQLEGAVGVPLLPILKKISTLFFSDSLAGPSIVLRGNVGGSVAGNYDACPKKGDVLGKVTGALEFLPLTFSNDFKVQQKNLGGSTSPVEGNMRLLDVGLSGNFGWNVTKLVGRSLPFEGDNAYVQVFVKSSVQYGLLNFTALDLQIPIYQGKTPSFSVGF
jgi:large repetitive protein